MRLANKAFPFGRLPLYVALVAVMAAPIGAFVLGTANAGRKLPGAWLWPVVIGAIPVVLGVVAIGRSASRRSPRRIWVGAIAVVLGGVAVYVGWIALLMGQLQREGILF